MIPDAPDVANGEKANKDGGRGKPGLDEVPEKTKPPLKQERWFVFFLSDGLR